jgi:hypothetical protein
MKTLEQRKTNLIKGKMKKEQKIYILLMTLKCIW